MNLEDSKTLLTNRLDCLEHGEYLLIFQEELEDTPVLIWWLEGAYLVLHIEAPTEGKWEKLNSVHSVINTLSADMIISWACDHPLP
tara:strand:+ start:201 stop:458 length:258 start_codon:yes stop_codon:yes gene_type:complete